MAENINISFAPNKSASESQRIADLEQYVSTLTERTKFAFASIIEEYNDTADDEQTVNMIYQATSESGSDVGQFTNTDKNCEIFNDYANNVAQAYYSHAEGYSTVASAPYTHAEGYMTKATAPSAHAEGEGTVASQNAHAEGRNTQATGYASHAEGENTTASGWLSHAEGKNTVANGMYAHAEGENCKAIGSNSHAGGMYSEALSEYSFAHGYGAKSSWTSGTALGRRNKTQNTLFVIGNGDWQEGSESDALTLDENGMLWIEGSFEASAKHGGLGITIHGAARFGDNWTSDGVDTLLAVGNGYDSERTRDALTLDKNGNLYISGKLTADGGIDIPIATAESVGGVKIGDNLTISEDGTLSANSGGYTLPVATADTLGGVKIGDNISVTADGTISVDLSAYLKSADISDWAKQSDKPTYTASEIGLGNVDNTADADKPISTATQTALDGKADTGHTHTVSDITDMPAYLTEETDPTVPAWAKAESKPVYTADEVGAAAEQHKHSTADITDFPAIPTKVSDLQNDSGYISEETDPTVPAWAKAKSKPTYTAEEVGAAPKSHTHSKSDITDFPTAMKNPSALTVQMNGTTAAKYDGGTAKTVNITPSGIGAATADDISAAINGIEIGGRNLWLKTKEYDASSYSGWVDNKSGSRIHSAPYTTVNGFGVQRIAARWRDVSQRVTIEANTVYTLSAWIKWESSTSTMRFYINTGSELGTDVTSQVGTTDYKRVFITFNSGDATTSTCRFECPYDTPYLIYGLKLEKGNKPTDWTPAPEDSPDYIIIGGRNLLLDTSTPVTYTASEIVTNKYITRNPPTPYFFSKRAVGKWVTVSFDYEATNASGKMAVNWSGSPWHFCGGNTALALTSANQKGRYVMTRQITQADVDMPETRSLSVVLVGFIGSVTISNIQLEFGNTPSDWTPAPEDDERRIASLEARVAALEAAAVSGGEV